MFVEMQSLIAEEFIELKCAQLAKKQQLLLQSRSTVHKNASNESACSSARGSSGEPAAASSCVKNGEGEAASSNSSTKQRERVAALPMASKFIGAIGRAGEHVGRITGEVLGSALSPTGSMDDDDEEQQLYESYRQAREAGAFDYSIGAFKRLLDEAFDQLVFHSARVVFKHASAYIEQRYAAYPHVITLFSIISQYLLCT